MYQATNFLFFIFLGGLIVSGSNPRWNPTLSHPQLIGMEMLHKQQLVCCTHNTRYTKCAAHATLYTLNVLHTTLYTLNMCTRNTVSTEHVAHTTSHTLSMLHTLGSYCFQHLIHSVVGKKKKAKQETTTLQGTLKIY